MSRVRRTSRFNFTIERGRLLLANRSRFSTELAESHIRYAHFTFARTLFGVRNDECRRTLTDEVSRDEDETTLRREEFRSSSSLSAWLVLS